MPEGAAPEVARVLQASTWYEVLEVSTSATDDEVRRAHKTKSLLTHPDKLGANDVGAHDAVIRVNAVRYFPNPFHCHPRHMQASCCFAEWPMLLVNVLQQRRFLESYVGNEALQCIQIACLIA